MCLKRLMRFLGHTSGEGLKFGWHAFWKIAFYSGVVICLFLGIILAFLGELIVFLLGALLTLCVGFLKVFAKFTERLLITTKWASGKVSDYTETFFNSISDVFKKEEEHLEQEIRLIIQTQNS